MTGVLVVAAQELRVRMRAGRWRWLLVAWFLVLFGFLALFRSAYDPPTYAPRGLLPERGTAMFGSLMIFLLALALIVVPALGAQSVNGDRERGT